MTEENQAEVPSTPAAADAPSAPAADRKPDQRRNRRGSGRGQNQNSNRAETLAAAQGEGGKPQQVRQVNPVLEKLFELYPHLFGAQFLPLKLGVFQDLLARHPDDFKKDELKLAMGQHARSTRYLESVAAGHPRHDLDGEPVEPVAPEHVHHALLEIFRRRQARSRDDLRPRLHARLVEAIEASGLSRDAYAELVRVQDEATNALVDEAVAELAVQAAKREALVRAHKASGKTVAEFADMYGMKPADVENALARVKREEDALESSVAVSLML